MSRSSIERKLSSVSEELVHLRQELSVLDEQLRHFVDEADEARLRSLVSETPADVREHREAAKAVAGIRRDREARMKQLAKLETKQDALLDELTQLAR